VIYLWVRVNPWLSNPWLYVIVITFIPWIELRGSIPVAILGYNLNPLAVFVVTVLANIAVILPAFVFLDWVFHLLERVPFFRRQLERTRQKAKPYIEKYGMVGLALFVGVPLPGTGAYSGALAAHIFGMKDRRAFVSISAGVFLAGVAVTLMTAGVQGLFSSLF